MQAEHDIQNAAVSACGSMVLPTFCVRFFRAPRGKTVHQNNKVSLYRRQNSGLRKSCQVSDIPAIIRERAMEGQPLKLPSNQLPARAYAFVSVGAALITILLKS